MQNLPDIGRSIEEQEVEIGELERRCDLLRERLKGLGEIAAGGLKSGTEREDEIMGGVEEKNRHGT